MLLALSSAKPEDFRVRPDVNEQTKTYAMYCLAALLAMQMLIAAAGDTSKKPETPAPSIVAPSGPSTEMRAIVAPISAVRLRNVEAAVKVAPFYRAAADVLQRDDGKIKTTGQFRQSRIVADELYLKKTPLVGSLGIGPPSDKAIADAIGLEDVALDAAKRQRLIDVLDAIAWALEGGE